jgi:hypothetical protein
MNLILSLALILDSGRLFFRSDWYRDFFPGGMHELRQWAARMSMPGHWGDNVALNAIAEVLGQPIFVWRHASKQDPILVMPITYDENEALLAPRRRCASWKFRLSDPGRLSNPIERFELLLPDARSHLKR